VFEVNAAVITSVTRLAQTVAALGWAKAMRWPFQSPAHLLSEQERRVGFAIR
jgi:hypothetical protein